ncbi:MAG TPA: ARMT1-like domain-containing protein, partial [Tichowtungia sp.]|nr:ARMT1-like domain-containing protein [Tichowtungia sp.]
VTLAVRGAPILNDALEEDARMAGLDQLVPMVGNGSDVPGTDIRQCSEEFRQHFESADLIISKGQGNFETLSSNPRRIFFLFKVKCPIVAEASGKPLGAHVLMEKSGL